MNGELFVYKIWSLCKAKGLSRGDFYSKTGISPSSMSLYKRGPENGGNRPSLDTLQNFADVLDVDVSYLLADVQDDETKKESAPKSESELDGALIKLLSSLTPTELAQVQGFAAALISARKA